MSKPKAVEVAVELRKLADAIEKGGEVELERPTIYFHAYEKNTFLELVKLLPKPVTKSIDYPDQNYARLRVGYSSNAILVDTSVSRDLTCEIVEPAKPAVYRCEPILSQIEEEGLAAG